MFCRADERRGRNCSCTTSSRLGARRKFTVYCCLLQWSVSSQMDQPRSENLQRIGNQFDGFVSYWLYWLRTATACATHGRTDGLDQFLRIILSSLENRLKIHQYRFGTGSKPVEASVYYGLCLIRCVERRLIVERVACCCVVLTAGDTRCSTILMVDTQYHLTGRRTNLGSVPGRNKRFVSTTSWRVLRPTQPSIQQVPGAVFTFTGCSVNNVGQCFLSGGYMTVTCPDAFHCIDGRALAWAVSRRPVTTEACDGSRVWFVVDELALPPSAVAFPPSV